MYAPTADLNQKKNIVRASPGKLLSRDFQVTVDESAEWKMRPSVPDLSPSEIWVPYRVVLPVILYLYTIIHNNDKAPSSLSTGLRHARSTWAARVKNENKNKVKVSEDTHARAGSRDSKITKRRRAITYCSYNRDCKLYSKLRV